VCLRHHHAAAPARHALQKLPVCLPILDHRHPQGLVQPHRGDHRSVLIPGRHPLGHLAVGLVHVLEAPAPLHPIHLDGAGLKLDVEAIVAAIGDEAGGADHTGEQGLLRAGFIPHHDDLLPAGHSALEQLQGVLPGLALHYGPAVLIHANMELQGRQAVDAQRPRQAQAGVVDCDHRSPPLFTRRCPPDRCG